MQPIKARRRIGIVNPLRDRIQCLSACTFQACKFAIKERFVWRNELSQQRVLLRPNVVRIEPVDFPVDGRDDRFNIRQESTLYPLLVFTKLFLKQVDFATPR